MEGKDKITERLTKLLEMGVADKTVAGINALVIKDGEEVAYAQAGYADVDSRKPFNRNTIMRMYSMSKPITSAAVMILVERGLISLGEPVYKYLPGFVNQKLIHPDQTTEIIGRPAYIKDLMSMTSGLPYGDANADSYGNHASVLVQNYFDEIDKKLYTKDAIETVEIANKLGEIGVSFVPGSDWMYGTSADVLGAIVEVVSGMKYGDFLKKELFEPLEMADTGFFVEADKHDRIASVYEKKDGELVFFPTNHLGIRYSLDVRPAFESGGAGIISTIDDYSHFAQMLINGGEYKGKRILSEATVRYMTHGRLMDWQQETMWRNWDGHSGYSYGCLMQHMIDTEKAYFYTWPDEYGWDGWLGTYFVNSPTNKVTILLGMQITGPTSNIFFEKVRNLLGQVL